MLCALLMVFAAPSSQAVNGTPAKRILSFISSIERSLYACQPPVPYDTVCYATGGYRIDAQNRLRERSSRLFSEIAAIESGNVCLLADVVLIEDALQRTYNLLSTTPMGCGLANNLTGIKNLCYEQIPPDIRPGGAITGQIPPGIDSPEEYYMALMQLAVLMKEHLEEYAFLPEEVGVKAFQEKLALEENVTLKFIYDTYWESFYGFPTDFSFTDPTYKSDSDCGDPLQASLSEEFSRLMTGMEMISTTGQDLFLTARAFFTGDTDGSTQGLSRIFGRELEEMRVGAASDARSQVHKLFRQSLKQVGGGLLYLDRSEQNWFATLLTVDEDTLGESQKVLKQAVENDRAEQEQAFTCPPNISRDLCQAIDTELADEFDSAREFRLSAQRRQIVMEQFDIAIARQLIDLFATVNAPKDDDTYQVMSTTEFIRERGDHIESVNEAINGFLDRNGS